MNKCLGCLLFGHKPGKIFTSLYTNYEKAHCICKRCGKDIGKLIKPNGEK